ncbi:MAG: tRNA-dihydrouridine synthase [Verrucomicrobia bacterium]|nr:tRNA-dihydrouridine synthase [Verrucomicrobiota bacterium]MBU4428242.1 tRNA-dihydrouridine synthase [Verrucomicrobiota bacterium]MCG2679541.1 tRNA-dihydrouridine synthase [Kiritimatiellia bacterium]
MTLKPLRIGAVKVDFPVLLAPMAGYTDAVMRALARRYHCGMAFTEMANAEGIVRGSKPIIHILETTPGERPVAAHIYGAHPDTLAQAAAIIEQTGRFQVIDFNCGCPVAKIVSKGAGAALMKHPDKIAQIVRAMTQAVSLPVTVKTRLGLAPDHMNISEIAQAVEESGGSAITIHARFADGRHAGPPDWPALARIKSERTIPVIGNGGITSADNALLMLTETGVDGVMIGQAAIGNPWIFRETWSVLRGQRPLPHSVREHRAIIEEHLRLLIAHKDKAIRAKQRPRRCNAERDAVLHFRAHLAGYIRGFKKSAAWRKKLSTLQCLADVLAMLEELRAAPGFDRLEH